MSESETYCIECKYVGPRWGQDDKAEWLCGAVYTVDFVTGQKKRKDCYEVNGGHCSYFEPIVLPESKDS